MSLRERLQQLPRHQKRLIQVVADVLLVWLALWGAFYLRLGSAAQIEPLGGHAWLFAIAPCLAIPLFVRAGMYRAVMRYVGNDALLTIARAVSLSSLLLVLAIYWHGYSSALVPRSMVFNYWWLSLLLLGGLRLLMRQYFQGDWYSVGLPFLGRPDTAVRVAIYGAGSAGNQLLAALRAAGSLRPVAFLDDDPQLAGRIISGLRVYPPGQLHRLLEDTAAREILLALPSVTHARRREILARLEPWPLRVRSVPSISALSSGQGRVQDLQEVDIADLLGRDAVEPHPELLERCIRGRVVLVSGAGGSIGSELCRQILGQEPCALILLEHAEYSLYRIHRELEQRLRQSGQSIRLVPVLGSVRDPRRLLEILQVWQVETLYHAAAYKHVPMVEHNVAEGVLNNVFGTLHLAQAAIRARVRHFVLVSTDKAVRPTNVMGSTKRLAELLLQAFSQECVLRLYGEPSAEPWPNQTRFIMVRFGNVLGSSGSVIPLFREQIRQGGPVTVTHPEITRYFMTIPEAAQLVIQAGAMGRGGDVFVLDMGQPVRIVELAEKLIRLSGLRIRDSLHPDGDIALAFTGLRPGEKLYEELLIGDGVTPTDHPMIRAAHEDFLPWASLCQVLAALEAAVRSGDVPLIRQILCQQVSGYRPEGGIVDWAWLQRQACETAG